MNEPLFSFDAVKEEPPVQDEIGEQNSHGHDLREYSLPGVTAATRHSVGMPPVLHQAGRAGVGGVRRGWVGTAGLLGTALSWMG